MISGHLAQSRPRPVGQLQRHTPLVSSEGGLRSHIDHEDAAASRAAHYGGGRELIYLDFNATTPLDPNVFAAMTPWMTERFWNASSNHAGGRAALDAVESAREQLAQLVGCRRGELVWTSGATEANNLAIKGGVEMCSPDRRRVVTVATEHKAVLDPIAWLGQQGLPTSVLPVDKDGRLSLDRLRDELELDDVAVVSVMAANNETGVLTDLSAIVDMAHHYGALVHSDETQLLGKLPVDVSASGVDLASFSAHKVYGPKGVGALFASRRIHLAPLLHGGGHERGLRSGTLNVPGIVGFGAAAGVATTYLRDGESDRQRRLSDELLTSLRETVDRVVLTSASPRLPNTVNLRIEGADAEGVMANAPGVAVSSGSACTALMPEPSHVLLAMGYSDTAARECLRFSLGRSTTERDIRGAATQIGAAVVRVRMLNS